MSINVFGNYCKSDSSEGSQHNDASRYNDEFERPSLTKVSQFLAFDLMPNLETKIELPHYVF